jgi:hypothetical protein
MTPTTALAIQVATHVGCSCDACGGQFVRLLAEAELGSIQMVVSEGPLVPSLRVQRIYLTSRNVGGKAITFQLDLPIDKDAEPGSRVYKERP